MNLKMKYKKDKKVEIRLLLFAIKQFECKNVNTFYILHPQIRLKGFRVMERPMKAFDLENKKKPISFL